MTTNGTQSDLTGEAWRLEALESYAILDTPPEDGFEDVVLLACQICETPVALVSLVSSDRQWFKAQRGFGLCETPLTHSVCALAIKHDGLLIIPDLEADPRTKANPLVTGDPHLRFYAGAPLVTPQGAVLGSLCVIDQKPRAQGLTAAQSIALAALGRQVMTLLESRRALFARDEAIAKLKASESSLRTIVETVPVGIMFAEAPSGKIIGRNGRMREITGHALQDSKTIGEYGDWIAFHADGRRVESHEFPLARVIRDGNETASLEMQYQRRDATRIWIEINAAAIRSEGGALTGAVVAVSDIDARKNAEAMQSLLNEELSHRMKNLLAMVQAIVVQTLRGVTDVAVVRNVLNNRLVALGKAHDILLGGIAKRAQIETIIQTCLQFHEDGDVRITCSGPPLEIGGKATLALGMMVHELATNAAKYGALSRAEGRVDIQWTLFDDAAMEPQLQIEWRESGGPRVEPPARQGFGTRLIERGLTGQVGGTVALTYDPGGLACLVKAPLAGFQRET